MTTNERRGETGSTGTDWAGLEYLYGFGNEHHTEALSGALPWGQNSPQQPPMGLYAEQHSATAFTEPRERNRRSWVYRILPSAAHPPFVPLEQARLRSAQLPDGIADPNRMRWDPAPIPDAPTDFVDGLETIGATGDVLQRAGIGIHWYVCNRSMRQRYFADADGELLLVPQYGRLFLHTEYGKIALRAGEIAVIGRAVRFRVELLDEAARGYVCENYGTAFTLPELGPIGANGLAHARHFAYPVAAYEEHTESAQVIQKFGGSLWTADYDHSPLDVVAWYGSHGAYKYDLERFNVFGTLNYDHPDPSISTILTAPSETPGQANVDFLAFPPHWVVAEHTFRPPHFHRNVCSEFMGLVSGVHESKAEGFRPGGASLHNMWAAHGTDRQTHRTACEQELAPEKLTGSLPFMFETRWPVVTTAHARDAAHRQRDYDESWSGFPAAFTPGREAPP